MRRYRFLMNLIDAPSPAIVYSAHEHAIHHSGSDSRQATVAMGVRPFLRRNPVLTLVSTGQLRV
jgi:hypothetical protein